jgi:(p)ppGpp synthase/HD superfamily hydrolase
MKDFMEQVLKTVRDFADQAHGTQTRRYTPERYIAHPMRVMEICRQFTSDVTVLSAALLHDVLEDTPVDKEQMRAFLMTVLNKVQAERTLELVEDLTDVFVKKDYPQWNRQKRKAKEADRLSKIDAEAQSIKYADIIDNSREIVKQDPDFAPVFLFEYKRLLERMNKGNKELYAKAEEMIKDGLKELKKR